MQEVLSFSFKSRTGIVTGDHQRHNQALIAKGIRGSLKYQYWLIKAMEHHQNGTGPPPYNLAPDTSEYRKTHDRNDLASALKVSGPLVQLFGATGWYPVYQMEIQSRPGSRGSQIVAAARPNPSIAPFNWKFSLLFKPHRAAAFEILKTLIDPASEIQKLMTFVHDYGWLGSAPQNGFGWVEFENEKWKIKPTIPDNPFFAARDLKLTHNQCETIKKRLVIYYKEKLKNQENIYKRSFKANRYRKSLQTISASNSGPPPIGYEIRRYLKENMNSYASFFGSGGNDGRASNIHVSHPVLSDSGWQIRLRFCFMPGQNLTRGHSDKTPGAVLDKCEEMLKS